ncbi:MAG: hypothetical protein QF676_08615 [Dehalococcoidia bacterium]|nr:hypothetical protein [Dehalococcoidia bacterium]
MRKLLAVLLACLFLILFFVSMTVNQVVDTASKPDVIAGMLDDADAYDYVYDNIVGNLIHDVVGQGIEFDSGLDESAGPTVLTFDDSDAAAVAIIELIETLIPREYVQEKLEESLNGVFPYAQGGTDEFTIDLEVQERVRSVPGAVRKVVTDLDLTERLISDLLVPQFGQFTDQVSTQALGIEFTSQELEDDARLIFEAEWLEDQLFGATDQIIPYFAGDADSFNVVVQFDDRVVIVGQILKDKLGSEDTLYNLVFAQVVDPLIQQQVEQSTSVGYGVALTEDEVVEAFEIIAPRAWVQEQGLGVIDALIDYLIGRTDVFEYTVDLSERKTTAAEHLQDLARRKLESTVVSIPPCSSPADALAATQDLVSQQIPRCIAGGQSAVSLVLDAFGDALDAQVASFVESRIPSQISYSQADLGAQVSGDFGMIEDLRTHVIKGIRFTDQDLIDAMADENNPESRADAEQTLKILADGVIITEEHITDNLEPEALQQFNDARNYAGTALSVRRLLWVLILIPLFVIALIGGRGWPGRLKWAGGVAAVCALIVYGGIAVAWPFNDAAQEYVSDYGAEVSYEFRADYPRLSAELESTELTERFERAMNSWQQGWRNQTIPWIIGGIATWIAGFVLGLGSKRGISRGLGTVYKSSSAEEKAATAFSIPEKWSDDTEEARADAQILADEPEILDGEQAPPASGDDEPEPTVVQSDGEPSDEKPESPPAEKEEQPSDNESDEKPDGSSIG